MLRLENDCEAWETALLRWEVARGLPHSFDRIRGEATIMYNLSCVAVKRQIASELYSKCIHQFLADRILRWCEIKDLQKDYTVLCRLYMLVQQLNNLSMLEDILSLLWKITINYIILLLSTGYDSNEQDSLVKMLQLFTNCPDLFIKDVALTLHYMIQQHEGSLVNIEPSDTILYLKGTQLFHHAEWDAAITAVHSCTESSNALVSSATNLLIGCCHAKQGRYQMALSTIQKVMKDDERLLVYALHNLVQVFIGLSNPDGEMTASELLYQALSYKEDSPKASNCQWNGFWLPVAHDDKSSLRISNNSILIPHMLGDLAIQTYQYACRAYHNKRFEVTVKLLITLVDNTVLPLESDHLPTPTQIAIDLCHSLVCAGYYDEAILRCDALLKLLTTQSTPHCMDNILNDSSSDEMLLIQARLLLYKGEALHQIGDPHKAIVQYRSGLQKLSIVEQPSNEMSNQLATQLLNNLSLILIGINRNAEALSLFNEAIERNPRNKACIYNHTLLLWKMGHVNKAIEGWIWYRELVITTHEQCQRTLQQLNKSELPQEPLDQCCLLMDKSILSYTMRQLLS